MIEKERLQELIEQGATIYFVYKGNVDLKEGIYKDDFILGETHLSIYWSTRSHALNYEDLFETKEEAEWHKEFGCIERTERLELPTWEEKQKYERFDFKDKYNHSYTLHYISGFKNLAISGWSTEYYAPATKQNYTLACRKAKELFLGEKK